MLYWIEMVIYAFIIYVYVALGTILGFWQYSIWQVDRAIRDNPGFEQRLQAYAQQAQAHRVLADSITVLEPAVKVIAYTKTAGVWEDLLTTSDSALPGAKAFLRLIDALFDRLITLRDQWVTLSELDMVAAAVGEFRHQPSKHKLEPLSQTLLQRITLVNAFVEELKTVSDLSQSVSNSVVIVTNGLQNFTLQENRLLGPLVSQLHRAIVPIEHHSSHMATSFTEQVTVLDADVKVMRLIIRQTRQAQWIESFVAPGPLISVINHVYESYISTAIIVISALLLRLKLLQLRMGLPPQKEAI